MGASLVLPRMQVLVFQRRQDAQPGCGGRARQALSPWPWQRGWHRHPVLWAWGELCSAWLWGRVGASPSIPDFTGAEGRENPSLSEGPLWLFFYKTHHFSPCNVNSLFPRMNSRQGARERGWWWAWGCGALQGWAQAESQSWGRVLGEPGSGEGSEPLIPNRSALL